MVQNSASRQFAFWPDYCITSSKRSLPITVRLIAFQKRDGNIYIQHLLTILATMCDSMPHAKALGNNNITRNRHPILTNPIYTICIIFIHKTFMLKYFRLFHATPIYLFCILLLLMIFSLKKKNYQLLCDKNFVTLKK